MRNRNRHHAFVTCAVTAIALLSAAMMPASAQSDYPNRPIRVIVGFAAGGGTDIFARLVGAKLSQLLGQPVVIENKPGAGGRLAAEYAARQAPDGYTLMVAPTGAMSIAAAIYPDLPYQPIETFTPLGMVAGYPLIMVVAANHPARTVHELIEWAKQHPDRANYASTAPSFTIATELFKLESGMPGLMIPYKSSNEMTFSVINGQTMVALADPPPVVPQAKAGTIRALAVTGDEPLPELPDVPSMAAAGYKNMDVHLWNGAFAPAATPGTIVAKLQNAVGEAVRDAGVSEKLKNLATTPGGGTPEQFKAMIAAEIVRYKSVVERANLHFEE